MKKIFSDGGFRADNGSLTEFVSVLFLVTINTDQFVLDNYVLGPYL